MSKTPGIKDLLEAGAHFGHQSRRWNPKMASYIFTDREGIHIIDLEKTEKKLEQACNFIKEVASKPKGKPRRLLREKQVELIQCI